jgi:hypothetical protein
MLAPDTATVVVTPRERYSVARRTFASVAANTPGHQRFVYVAGGAPADFREFLESECRRPNYELILTPDFLQPNTARNLGLARVATKYVVFLDNDIAVEPGWLEALVRCAEEEDADLVAPLCLIGEAADLNLHNLGGRLLIEPRGDRIWMRERHHFGQINLRGRRHLLRRMSSEYSEFHCMLLRRAVLDRLGPFDEAIGGSAEHIDLAMHMRELGCRGFAEPTAVVTHLALDYILGDLDLYYARWHSDRRSASLAYFAQKWGLVPDAGMLADYRGDFLQKRERCLLRLDSLPEPPPAKAGALAPVRTIDELLERMRRLGYTSASLDRTREIHAVAAELLSTSQLASGRPQLAHALGTAGILADYGANPVAIGAALLDGAYALGEFVPPFDAGLAAMRRWLRRRVGRRIERLVFELATLQAERLSGYDNNFDLVPVELANAFVIAMAAEIERRLAGETLLPLAEWMPAFAATAGRTGFGAMTTVLRELAAQESARAPGAAPPPRRILAAEAREPAAVTGRYRSSIDLAHVQSSNGGVIGREGRAVRIDAVPRPWTYSATLPLADLVETAGPAIVEVSLECLRGEIGLQVLERGSSVHVVAPEQSLAAWMGRATLRFEVPAFEEAGDLVLRGWPHDDDAASALLFELTVLSDRPVAERGRRQSWLGVLAARLPFFSRGS